MNRDEHLTWCKQRALKYVEMNDLIQAYTSMGSDLNKHPETKDHPGIQIGIGYLMIGKLKSKQEMIDFINGFN